MGTVAVLVVVSKSGVKKWVLRYSLHGRRREMGLGNYPNFGLADARILALKCRRQVNTGAEPIKARRFESKRIPVFAACAARSIRCHRHGLQDAMHARQWVSTLKTCTRPVMGEKPVNAITTKDILQIPAAIWATKIEPAKRVQGRIEQTMDLAEAHRYRDPLNPTRWQGHLDKLRPRASRMKEAAHHPAMLNAEVPAFFDKLSRNGSVSALALQFLILTATCTLVVFYAE